MKHDEIKSKIHTLLSPSLDGFKYIKTKFEYTRRLNSLNYIYRIYLHSSYGRTKVQSAVFVGSPDVNKLFNKASNYSIPVNDTTWGYSVLNEYKGRGNYQVEDCTDIEPVVNQLKLDFNEIALPEFESIKSLQDLEKKMNKKNSSEEYRPNSNACLGIAAASLCNNPDFDKICKDYHQFCVQAQSEKLCLPILQIQNYIETHTS